MLVAGFEERRNRMCGYAPNEPEIADDFAEFELIAADADADADADVDRRAEPAPATEPSLMGARTMDHVLEMIDSGWVTAEDHSDDFRAVDIDGVRW